MPVGLFYHVNYDMSTPFNVCGGMQDNYDWCGPSQVRQQQGIFNHDWATVQGGDGFVSIPDRRDARIIYSESQDGNMTRKNKVTGESKSIRPTAQNVTPAPKQGESFRFHWDTPMIISAIDPGLLIVAANKVFVSRDRGDSWTVISPDLTTGASRDTIVTMGLKGSDIRISRDDGISQWPTIVIARRVAETGRALLHRQRGWSRLRVARCRQELAEHHEESSRLSGGIVRQRSRSVEVRRGHGLCHRRESSPERLQAVHVGEHRFWRDVQVDRQQSVR